METEPSVINRYCLSLYICFSIVQNHILTDALGDA